MLLMVLFIQFSKRYNNLFLEAGVAPKRKLTRFLVSPECKLAPGNEFFYIPSNMTFNEIFGLALSLVYEIQLYLWNSFSVQVQSSEHAISGQMTMLMSVPRRKFLQPQIFFIMFNQFFSQIFLLKFKKKKCLIRCLILQHWACISRSCKEVGIQRSKCNTSRR